MKLNFHLIQKIDDFNVLKQPGILSFDKVFLNSFNLGLAFISLNEASLKTLKQTINNKIILFEASIKKLAQIMPDVWMKHLQTLINQAKDFLASDFSQTMTFSEVINWIQDNHSNLILLSSIWMLSLTTKKPTWCETRKHYIYKSLEQVHGQALLTQSKPDFLCQKIEFINQNPYYLLLPSNWDVVDVCLWIEDTNLWVQYWINVHLVLNQIDDFDFNQPIVKQPGTIDAQHPINWYIKSNHSVLACNYLVPNRNLKDYKNNLSYLEPIIVSASSLLIIDPINGYDLENDQ